MTEAMTSPNTVHRSVRPRRRWWVRLALAGTMCLAICPGGLRGAVKSVPSGSPSSPSASAVDPELQLYGDLAVLFGQEKYAELISRVEARLKEKGESPASHFWYGKTLEAAGRLDEAEAAFGYAIELVPDGPMFHAGMASLLEKKLARIAGTGADQGGKATILVGRIEGHWKQAVSLDPEEPFYRALHAGFLLSRFRYEAAVQEITEAHDLDPNSPEVETIRGQVLFRAGAFEATNGKEPIRAIELLQDVARNHLETADVHYFLGVAYRKLGDDKQAIMHLTRCLEMLPDQPEATAELVRVHLGAGRLEEARTLLEAALTRQPDHEDLVDLQRELSGPEVAGEATPESIVRRLSEEGWRNGKLSPSEFRLLESVSGKLRVSREMRVKLLREAEGKTGSPASGFRGRDLTPLRAYALALTLVRMDRKISAEERRIVRTLARVLGITAAKHQDLLRRLKQAGGTR